MVENEHAAVDQPDASVQPCHHPGSLAVAAAFTLVGAQSVSARHVPGDDHTGTLLTVDPSATAQGQKTMFPTRAEAEAAAVDFDCEGAHQMGDMWMPCTEH